MGTISKSSMPLRITVGGYDREVDAEVHYIHSRAFGPIVERGSGIPISPPEPERAEIQKVIIDGGEIYGGGMRQQFDVLHLLTDEQVEAIEGEILGC